MEISAKILAHSKSSITGKEIITFEIVYPRMILAELNTHRILSKSSASSRAIPIDKVIESVRAGAAMPVHWGLNKPGMQATEEHANPEACRQAWQYIADIACEHASALASEGLHKQVVNRTLEPYQWMKTVITGTEFDNLWHLRRHTDTDPTFKALADVMYAAKLASSVVTLQPGDWHTPYFGDGYWLKGCGIPLEDALAISSSCCAQTSFRTTDDTLDKAKRIFERLVESKPVHASPFEHQASPMKKNADFRNKGITHMTRDRKFWSGNFCGWIQHRQLIPDNACWDYKENN